MEGISTRPRSQTRFSARGFVLEAPRAVRDCAFVLLAVLALAWTYTNLRWAIDHDAIALDFIGTLWEPGNEILEGDSPYPAPVVSEVDVGNPAYYPPLLLVLSTPLAVLPWAVAAVVWVAALSLAVVGALYVLGVRDPRCYALALTSAPVVYGLIWGNANLLLLPLVALAWHWRAHWVRVGTLVGLGIAAKFFLWPLLFWLAGTRRYRAFAAAAGVAAAGVLLPWAAIGFDGFQSYPDLLRVAERVYAVHGLSVATILGALGTETAVATRGGVALGGAIAFVSLVAGRKGQDKISISAAMLAAIVASPIVWEHYFALVLIPLALARPRFAALWMTLPLFYFTYALPAPRLRSGDIEPGGFACCPPDGFPKSSWAASHAPAALWPALGHLLLATAIIAFAAWTISQTVRDPVRNTRT